MWILIAKLAGFVVLPSFGVGFGTGYYTGVKVTEAKFRKGTKYIDKNEKGENVVVVKKAA